MYPTQEIHLYGDFGDATAVQVIRPRGKKSNAPEDVLYVSGRRVVTGPTAFHLHPADEFIPNLDPKMHLPIDQKLKGKVVRLNPGGEVGIFPAAADRDFAGQGVPAPAVA